MTKRRPTPPAVLAELREQGFRDGLRPGVPTRRHCAECGLAVLAMSDPWIPQDTVIVDALPVSATGEAHAVLAGDLTWRHYGREMGSRDARDIEYNPAADHVIFADHRCGRRLDVNWEAAVKFYPPKPSRHSVSDPPPY